MLVRPSIPFQSPLIRKIGLGILLSVPRASFGQCDTIELSAKQAKHASDAMFRGIVQGFRGADLGRTVIFQVTRVWKGRIGTTLEMPAVESEGALCFGFRTGQLKLGNDLIVSASRRMTQDGQLMAIPAATMPASDFKDLKALGRGHPPVR